MNSFSRRHFIHLGAAASLAPFVRTHAQEAGRKQLGVALLGLGDYSTKQLGPALKQTRNAKLTGIVTGSPEKVPVWQKEYGIPDGNVYDYANFDSIANNKEIDIVYVVTPTVADCNRMIEASKQAGRTLQIGYRLHWEPHHLRLIDAISKKEFGDWKSISTVNGSTMRSFNGLNAWRISKDLGIAGALYDLGVYCVQAAFYTAGMHPVSVTAKHSTDRPEIFKEVPETYEWSLEFPGGRKAEGMSSYGRNGNHVRAELEKGLIEIAPAYGYGGQNGKTPGGPMEFGKVFQQALQIDGQVASILAGTPSLVPGEMGARDIQVINGIVEAAATGKAVTFGKFPY